MNELKKFITNTIKSSFFWVKVKNASDITEPIVSALQGKDRKIINPSEISKPIVEAVDRGTKALAEKENKITNAGEIAEPIVEAVGMVDKSVKELGKSNGEERKKDIAELNENFVKMVSVLKTELSKLDSTEKMLAIFEALKKIQSSGDLLKVLGVIEKKIPVVKESKDYTDVLGKIYSGIEKITFDDLANRIDNIKFPAFPETMKVTTDFGKVLRGYAKDGRILVSPDRVGGGSFVDDVKIKNASNELINPAREETLLLVKTACENIKLSADTVNLNTDTLEAKLDTLIAKDYATQTTLAAVLAKIIAAPATAAKQLPDNHQVSVSNPPAEYPLPAAQVSTLTPPAAISGFATEAKQLPDGHEVEVNNFPATQPVSGTVAVSNPTADPETGLAKSAKQDSQITLHTALNSLLDTLQELAQRLMPLAGAMGNTAQLRVVQSSVPSTAVTGPITSAQSIAEKNVAGVSYTQRVAQENLAAVLSNINNVTT